MQKIKLFFVLFFLALSLSAEDIYSAYKKDFATFQFAVETEYKNFEPLQMQYPEYFGIISEMKSETQNESSFHSPKMDSLVSEYLYQKTQIQSRNETSLIFGFIGLALFGVVAVFLVIVYFVFINEQQKQRIIMSAIISEIEKERSRIACELHDSVAQDLRASSISKNPDRKTELEMKAISNIRSICFNLNPPGLEQNRLDNSIRELCSNFQSASGIETNLFIDEKINFENFTGEEKINIYRIIQESLNNVLKHSQSDSVSVTVQQFQQKIAIEISDDGIGFDVENPPAADSEEKHFGLNSMEQRAKILGGKFKVTSEKNVGTVVRLELN